MTDISRYELASLYFSAGYLSLAQSIEVDAIRAAIDAHGSTEEKDWLLAAWITALSVVVNAPGHTAQYLRANTILATLGSYGCGNVLFGINSAQPSMRYLRRESEGWRSQNTVYVSDALDLIGGSELENVGIIYADPPYTKDQYSRYYHVYETLYLYDFPDSRGLGRNRSDRFTTGFCLKTAVVASFHDLCRNVARMKVPLVISYPTAGLLSSASGSVPCIAGQYFGNVKTFSFEAKHSTMGASNGTSKMSETRENVYVCTG